MKERNRWCSSGRQGAGAGQLGVVGGPIHEVPARDDHVVAATEEAGRRLELALLAQGIDEFVGASAGLQLVADDSEHVRPSHRRGQVGGLAVAHPRGELVAVVVVPVVEGEDLEQVRDAAELGPGGLQFLRRDAVPGLPGAVGVADHPRLLRRGVEVAALAERAVAAVLRRVERDGVGQHDAERTVAAARHRPHLRAAERVELLDRAVLQPADELRLPQVGMHHVGPPGRCTDSG